MFPEKEKKLKLHKINSRYNSLKEPTEGIEHVQWKIQVYFMLNTLQIVQKTEVQKTSEGLQSTNNNKNIVVQSTNFQGYKSIHSTKTC